VIEILCWALILYLCAAIYLIHRLQKSLNKTTTCLIEERERVCRIKAVVKLTADQAVYNDIKEM